MVDSPHLFFFGCCCRRGNKRDMYEKFGITTSKKNQRESCPIILSALHDPLYLLHADSALHNCLWANFNIQKITRSIQTQQQQKIYPKLFTRQHTLYKIWVIYFQRKHARIYLHTYTECEKQESCTPCPLSKTNSDLSLSLFLSRMSRFGCTHTNIVQTHANVNKVTQLYTCPSLAPKPNYKEFFSLCFLSTNTHTIFVAYASHT